MAVLRDQIKAILDFRTATPASDFFSQIDSYAITAAEIAASVTPVNYAYPPLTVDRYGTNTSPGVTPMEVAFNSAVKVGLVAGGTVRYGATSPYLLNNPINVTTAGSPNMFGLVIRNEQGPASTSFVAPSLIANHTGHVFDLTGTPNVVFENVSIGTGAATPKTAFFQARTSPSISVGITRFMNCAVQGSFSVACYYNYGAEDDQIVGGYWQNNYTGGASKVLQYTGFNIAGQTSSFQTVMSGQASAIDHKIFGGEFFNNSSNAAADCIGIETSDSVKIFGPWMYCASASANGRSLVYVDMTNGASNFCLLQGITGEQSTHLQNYGVLFSNHVATPSGWTIDSCKLNNGLFAIATLNAGTILDSFHIRQISEGASTGISVPGTIQTSTLDTGAVPLIIGTSKNSTLIGYSDRWTVTTRTDDFWIDSGTVNKSWTPAKGTMSATTFVVNEARFLLVGNMVHFQCTITGTGLAATLGQTMTGLPFAAAHRCANVCVSDENTHGSLGVGFIETAATTILLPAFAATTVITLSGSYFVA